ncbi:MAG: hypothetical protein Kow00109_29630 [Acidobacteriota bacterium]
MFDRHRRFFARTLWLMDLAVLVPALVAAYEFREWVVLVAPEAWADRFHPVLLPFETYLLYLLLFLPALCTALLLTQRYEDLLSQPWNIRLRRIVYFLTLAAVLMGFLSFTFRLEVSRPIFFVFLGLMAAALPLNRLLLEWVIRSRNLNEHNQIRILIVGVDDTARRVGELLREGRKWGYHVVGYVRNGAGKAGVTAVAPEEIVCELRELPARLQEGAVAEEIIFAGQTKEDLDHYMDILRLCQVLGIRTRIAADFLPPGTTVGDLESLQGLPLITFAPQPDHGFAKALKRVMDFAIAAVSLILLSPLMAATALAIKLTSPGPILYRQTRCGLYGRRFTLYKFRTMVDGAEDLLWDIFHLNEMDGPVFKMRNDPRVTKIGRFLRKYSIDELPQLWNVLKGEMSIVGPRAPLPYEVEYYKLDQRRRLSVKPGITCLWQVSGRNDISFEKWMELDLQYIDRWSLWLDLRILFKTIPAVITGRGAR